MEIRQCPECKAPLISVKSCQDYFNQMLAWDFEDFKGAGRLHHLTVLCYYLQHPSHYSPEGLKEAVTILKKAIENTLSDKKLYQEESEVFSSSKRTWNVTGTSKNYGKYSSVIKWTITVSEVVKDGVIKYPEHVQQWANAIYSDLKTAGELV
jgi:hypothetical protein